MIEIERKFLLNPEYNIEGMSYSDKVEIEDLYLTDRVRVRNKNNDSSSIVTIKNKGTLEREEFEFRIITKPRFEHIPPLVKTRLTIPYNNQNFEINIFKHIKYRGNQLILIELELKDKNQVIDKPEWLGEEVTYDERFYGYNLATMLKFKEFEIAEEEL